MMLQILDSDGSILAYITARPCNTNWLSYIQCARGEHEQNVDAVQVGSQIYYKVTKVS